MRKTESKRLLNHWNLQHREIGIAGFKQLLSRKELGRKKKNMKEKNPSNEPPCIISNPATAASPLISPPLGEKRGYTKQQEKM